MQEVGGKIHEEMKAREAATQNCQDGHLGIYSRAGKTSSTILAGLIKVSICLSRHSIRDMKTRELIYRLFCFLLLLVFGWGIKIYKHQNDLCYKTAFNFSLSEHITD